MVTCSPLDAAAGVAAADGVGAAAGLATAAVVGAAARVGAAGAAVAAAAVVGAVVGAAAAEVGAALGAAPPEQPATNRQAVTRPTSVWALRLTASSTPPASTRRAAPGCQDRFLTNDRPTRKGGQ